MSDRPHLRVGQLALLAVCLAVTSACSTGTDGERQHASSVNVAVEEARSGLLAAKSLDELREAVAAIVVLDADEMAPELVRVARDIGRAGPGRITGKDEARVLPSGRVTMWPPEFFAVEAICVGLGDIAGPESISGLGRLPPEFAYGELKRVATTKRNATLRFRARIEMARLISEPPLDPEEAGIFDIRDRSRIAAALGNAAYVSNIMECARIHFNRPLGSSDREAFEQIAVALRTLGATDAAAEVEAVVNESRRVAPPESGDEGR